ncbi:MAG: hypothetical protein LBD92_01160 [Oscillospiraceae bacterium]|jgi:hypothetical protein|nr:hypothetical protein [Oscillospiraceae bacterium]
MEGYAIKQGEIMRLLPQYAENIIVGTICNAVFDWYVTDIDVWYMDLHILQEGYRQQGYEINIDNPLSIRCGVPILDKDGFLILKERMTDYLYTVEDLRTVLLMLKEESEDWKFDMTPSIYINFDTNSLYTAYRETISFQSYVPRNWSGICREFLDVIPLTKRYWVDKNGNNLFSSAW